MAAETSHLDWVFTDRGRAKREGFCLHMEEKKALGDAGNWAPRKTVLYLAALLCVAVYGCAVPKVSPKSPESSMLMGRVLINNAYRGRNGLLPMGLQAERIQIEVRSDDRQRVARGSTDQEGYFFLPNLAPGDYYLRSVALEVVSQKTVDEMRFGVQFLKAQVSVNTVIYLGTLVVEVSKEGEFHFKEYHNEEKARQRLLQSFGGTEWEAREFVSAPPSSVTPPTGQLPRVKKEVPSPYSNPPRILR